MVCPHCAGNVKLDIDFIREEFKKAGLELISNKYKNNKEKLKYICMKCGLKHSVQWDNFSSGNRCPRCSAGRVSRTSQQWLDSLEVPVREKHIRINNESFFVDGFNPSTKTVYEFFGDYWHGNPEVFNPEDINPTSKKSYGKLYEDTIGKISKLRGVGYKVVYIWEKDFRLSRRKK